MALEKKSSSPTFLPPELFSKTSCPCCRKSHSVLKKRLELAPKKARFCKECIEGFEASGYKPWFDTKYSGQGLDRNPALNKPGTSSKYWARIQKQHEIELEIQSQTKNKKEN